MSNEIHMSNEIVLKLKAIAILAEMMALKVERGQNWPGELPDTVTQIAKMLSEIRERK
jgi:hypothetical protein